MELFGHLSPVVDVEEVISAPLVGGCLLRGAHPGGPGYPDPVFPVEPPVPVVELGRRGQLEDVAHVGVEHVEQDVVLVPVRAINIQWIPLKKTTDKGTNQL